MIIREGYFIKIGMDPPQHIFRMTPLTDTLWEEVQKLSSMDAIELVLTRKKTWSFFSRYFAVLKRDRGL